MSSINGDIDSNMGQQNYIFDGATSQHEVKRKTFRSMSVIQLPPNVSDVIFYVKGAMLQLLHIKGVYGSHLDEDPHNHIRNFLDVYNSLTLKDVSQQSIPLHLFPFRLRGDASKWLIEVFP